jgi:hypothetical protein
MPGDGVIDNVAPQGSQPREGAGFIRTDQAGIAHDIGHHDCCQSPYNLLAFH